MQSDLLPQQRPGPSSNEPADPYIERRDDGASNGLQRAPHLIVGRFHVLIVQLLTRGLWDLRVIQEIDLALEVTWLGAMGT